MINLGLRSDADLINDYLMGREASLSDALRLKLQRLQVVADLLSKHGSHRIVARKLPRLWPDDCSDRTAYRYIGEAQEVFSPKLMHDRAFYVDNLLASIKATHAMAKEAQDLKTMAVCEKNELALIEKFMGTNEALPIDKLQPPRMLFAFTPELAGQPLPANWQAQVEALKKKRKNVGVVAEHADFEDAQVLDETQPRSTTPGLEVSTSEK